MDHDSSPLRQRRARVPVSSRLFDQFPRSPRLWMSMSAACLMVAATAALGGHMDVAFVAAAVGVTAWFVNLRHHLRATYRETDEAEEEVWEDEADNEANRIREE